MVNCANGGLASGTSSTSSCFSPSERLSSKPSLTPTTLSSSEGSEPSNNSTPTAGVATPQHSSESSYSAGGYYNNSTVRLALPSPSRPRLDPQYTARLAPQLRTFNPSTCGISGTNGLIPPPGINRDRDESIFRPTPIVSPSIGAMDTNKERSIFISRSGSNPLNNIVSEADHFSPRFDNCSHNSNNFSSRLDYFKQSSSGSLSSPRRRSKRAADRSAADLGASDRFIPSRATSNFNINLWEGMHTGRRAQRHVSESEVGVGSNASNSTNQGGNNASGQGQGQGDETGDNGSNNTRSSNQNLLNVLLRSELLGENLNPFSSQNAAHPGSSNSRSSSQDMDPLRESGNRLHFQSPRQAYQANIFEDSVGPTAVVNSFSLTPVRSPAGQRLMAAPQKHKRRISKVPFKVLDAPALQDDFYLNLVDWSSQNVLAVGLGSCVYLWSACTSKVTKLCDLAQSEDIVTSVSWAQRGTHLAVGTNRGEVLLWDTIKCKKIRSMADHSARVGTLAWTGACLASGSRDRLIYLRDVRVQSSAMYADRLAAHKQEVCGLKWSFDEPAFLASGGNDNQLHVVDSRNPTQPVQRFSDHTAAVKAIAWSPHQHGLLASGGGTADRCIRFWNTLSGTSLSCVDTGSQVCNLAWSQNCNEIVSTHGYSLNQIVVWRYPSMNKVVTLTGHTYRVLYLAMSPDGSTIVTGAGDETLRFWQVFPGPRSDSKNMTGGLLFPNTLGSVIR